MDKSTNLGQSAGLGPKIFTYAMAILFVCTTLTIAAQKKSIASAPTGPSVFAQDKGKFTIQLDGKSVGHEEFELAQAGGGWTAHSTTDIAPPEAGSARVSGTLTLQPDGAPISYEWQSQAGKTNGARILFANGIAKITLLMQGSRPFEQDMSFGSPLIAVLDNNLYYQYAVVARVYDWTKGGAQTMPVLIPQELTPGSITVESAGSVTAANGKSYDGLRVATSDLEVMLYLDKTHRLERLEVPSAKVSVIRD
jgi:hypothetical protein